MSSFSSKILLFSISSLMITFLLSNFIFPFGIMKIGFFLITFATINLSMCLLLDKRFEISLKYLTNKISNKILHKNIFKPCDFYDKEFSLEGNQVFLVFEEKYEKVNRNFEFISSSMDEQILHTDNFQISIGSTKIKIVNEGAMNNGLRFLFHINDEKYRVFVKFEEEEVFRRNLSLWRNSGLKIAKLNPDNGIHILQPDEFIKLLTSTHLEIRRINYIYIGGLKMNIVGKLLYFVFYQIFIGFVQTLPLSFKIKENKLYLLLNLVGLVIFISFVFDVKDLISKNKSRISASVLRLNSLNRFNRMKDDEHRRFCESNEIVDLYRAKSDKLWCNIFNSERVWNPNCVFVLNNLKDSIYERYQHTFDIEVEDLPINRDNYKYVCGNEIISEIIVLNRNENGEIEVLFNVTRRNERMFQIKEVMSSIQINRLMNVFGFIQTGGIFLKSDNENTYDFEHSMSFEEILACCKENDFKLTSLYNLNKNVKDFYIGEEIVKLDVDSSLLYSCINSKFYNKADMIFTHNIKFFGSLNIDAIQRVFMSKIVIKGKGNKNSQFKKYGSDCSHFDLYSYKLVQVTRQKNTSEVFKEIDREKKYFKFILGSTSDMYEKKEKETNDKMIIDYDNANLKIEDITNRELKTIELPLKVRDGGEAVKMISLPKCKIFDLLNVKQDKKTGLIDDYGVRIEELSATLETQVTRLDRIRMDFVTYDKVSVNPKLVELENFRKKVTQGLAPGSKGLRNPEKTIKKLADIDEQIAVEKSKEREPELSKHSKNCLKAVDLIRKSCEECGIEPPKVSDSMHLNYLTILFKESKRRKGKNFFHQRIKGAEDVIVNNIRGKRIKQAVNLITNGENPDLILNVDNVMSLCKYSIINTKFMNKETSWKTNKKPKFNPSYKNEEHRDWKMKFLKSRSSKFVRVSKLLEVLKKESVIYGTIRKYLIDKDLVNYRKELDVIYKEHSTYDRKMVRRLVNLYCFNCEVMLFGGWIYKKKENPTRNEGKFDFCIAGITDVGSDDNSRKQKGRKEEKKSRQNKSFFD